MQIIVRIILNLADYNLQLVTEFFEYGINTILFQRGVYPPEDFSA